MTVKLRFEYICDVCKQPAGRIEEYTVQPITPTYAMAYPQPFVWQSVGNLHVCEECLMEAKNVLIEKFRRLFPEEEITVRDERIELGSSNPSNEKPN